MSATPGVAIRVATEEDIEFLVEALLLANVERYQHHAAWDATAFAERARETTLAQVRGEVADSVTSIITFAGERAGRLRVVRTSERLEIAGIQLLPAFQRRGIGTATIRSLLREGEQAGVPVVLEVEDDNPRARQLYLRLGFAPYEEGNSCTRMIALPGDERMGGVG